MLCAQAVLLRCACGGHTDHERVQVRRQLRSAHGEPVGGLPEVRLVSKLPAGDAQAEPLRWDRARQGVGVRRGEGWLARGQEEPPRPGWAWGSDRLGASVAPGARMKTRKKGGKRAAALVNGTDERGFGDALAGPERASVVARRAVAFSAASHAPRERKSTALRSHRSDSPADFAKPTMLAHVALLRRVTDSVRPLLRPSRRSHLSESQWAVYISGSRFAVHFGAPKTPFRRERIWRRPNGRCRPRNVPQGVSGPSANTDLRDRRRVSAVRGENLKRMQADVGRQLEGAAGGHTLSPHLCWREI